jgi:hypothetical protein
MRRISTIIPLPALLLIAILALPAEAALDSVSGLPAAGNPNQLTEIPANGDPAQVAISLANGFPVWYQGPVGLKLELCLQPPSEISPGVVIDPCELGLPSTGAPPSFPNNFGQEAMYWSAVVFGNYTSSGNVNNSALLVLSQQAGFANEGAVADGNQAVFSRIRLRIDVPVAGIYRVTHPFGSRDYVVTTPGVRAINQTQDRGLDVARDFLISMVDGPAPVEPVPFIPSISAGIVNADGDTIGPFLVPTQPHGGVLDPANPATFVGGPVAFNGATYIGLPFAPNLANPALPFDVFQPLTGGIFEITLTDPQSGFLLDAGGIDGNADNTVRFTNFQVIGRVFDDGPNLAPTAVADSKGTAPDTPVTIDVVANDLDAVGPANVHGINPQALALVHPVSGALVLNRGVDGQEGVPTVAGGRVRRVTTTQTGQTSFRYTPPIGHIGPDSFQYVVQDAGGLVSLPGTVSLMVEEIGVDRADFRPRLGKWSIAGTTSDLLANTMTLTVGPLAALSGAGEVPPTLTDARATASLRVEATAIDFALKVEPLPASAVTAAHIHFGAPGTNGPILFTLYNSLSEAAFTGTKSGTLVAANLNQQPQLGIGNFADAIDAILSGNTYVNVHTVTRPDGEIRGQLLRPQIGTAAVQPDGSWRFEGKAGVSPGPLPTVNVESTNGVLAPSLPLRLR